MIAVVIVLPTVLATLASLLAITSIKTIFPGFAGLCRKAGPDDVNASFCKSGE